MAFIEDRWYREADGKRVPTPVCNQGMRYRARWTDPDGRERSKSFPDKEKAAADRLLTNIKADMLRNTYLDPDAGKETLRSYTQRWLSTRSHDVTSAQTVRQRVEKHVLAELGKYRLDQLQNSPSLISAWVKKLPVADSYKAVLLHDLSTIMNTAIEDRKITSNPCKVRSVKAPKAERKKLRAWSADWVDGIREVIAGGLWLPEAQRGWTERYAGLIDVQSGLGLRQGEAFGFPADALSLGSFHVRLQVRIVGGRLVFAPPKGQRERDVPVTQDVQQRINAHMGKFPPRRVTLPWRDLDGPMRTETLVFTNGRGNAISRTGFNTSVWVPARRQAGIPALKSNGTHALRHFFASVSLAHGLDIETLSDILGHHDPGFTLRVYGHLRPKSEDRALKILEAAFRAERKSPSVPSTDSEAK